MDDLPRPNWRVAYHQTLAEDVETLRKARATASYNPQTGARSMVYVPTKKRKVFCEFLEDWEIRESAQFKAEVATNSAMNRWNEKYGT